MKKADLYKLPKDVLVHLISTIQHDLSLQLEQTKKNSKEKIDAIRQKCEFTSINHCSFEGCHRFFLFEENQFPYQSVEYYNDGRITFCYCGCNKYRCDLKADRGIGWWCEEHVPSNYTVSKGDNFNFICRDCKEAGHDKMDF